MVKLLFGVFAAIFLVMGLLALAISTSMIGGGAPSQEAQQDIPPQLMPVYQTAADSCPGLPWSVLAAIGKVETDHARSTAPGVRSGANFAGAAGPMQIGIGGKAGNTWAAYAIDADGGGADVYNPNDAIFTAANYLCQNGANKGADVAGAIFAYNHADWYVTKVLAIASTYAASQGLPPGAPAEDVAAAAVQYAYDKLGQPYRWGATGELGFYDCSGLMLRAYQAGGIDPAADLARAVDGRRPGLAGVPDAARRPGLLRLQHRRPGDHPPRGHLHRRRQHDRRPLHRRQRPHHPVPARRLHRRRHQRQPAGQIIAARARGRNSTEM